jgi:hypothetical protein
MPFSEQTKLEVKQKAAFRCCRCQSIGVDVHHIIPEKDGGLDDISNAAPLCPSCHDYFGDNPSKRKEITQMRDWWYSRIDKIWLSTGVESVTLSQIDAKVSNIQNQDISELKSLLKVISDTLISNMTPATATVTTSGIINTVVASSGAGAVPPIDLSESSQALIAPVAQSRSKARELIIRQSKELDGKLVKALGDNDPILEREYRIEYVKLLGSAFPEWFEDHIVRNQLLLLQAEAKAFNIDMLKSDKLATIKWTLNSVRKLLTILQA